MADDDNKDDTSNVNTRVLNPADYPDDQKIGTCTWMPLVKNHMPRLAELVMFETAESRSAITVTVNGSTKFDHHDGSLHPAGAHRRNAHACRAAGRNPHVDVDGLDDQSIANIGARPLKLQQTNGIIVEVPPGGSANVILDSSGGFRSITVIP